MSDAFREVFLGFRVVEVDGPVQFTFKGSGNLIVAGRRPCPFNPSPHGIVGTLSVSSGAGLRVMADDYGLPASKTLNMFVGLNELGLRLNIGLFRPFLALVQTGLYTLAPGGHSVTTLSMVTVSPAARVPPVVSSVSVTEK